MEPTAVVSRDEDVASARAGLTIAQRAALEYSRATAALSREQSLDRIRAVLSRADCAHDAAAIAALLASINRLGRVSVHFHPDRLIVDGRSVAEALRDEGVYRSQFETKISNGGLTAHPGGDRFQWEDRLFGSAYSAPTVAASERPKYGALDLLRHSDGAAPRFGSCFLRLKPSAMMRATFSVGDSFLHPTDNGPIDSCECVLAGLLEAIDTKRFNLGHPSISVSTLVTLLLNPSPPHHPLSARPGRSLDEYIETQLHGSLLLKDDVEMLVCDPAFRGSACGQVLSEISLRYSIPLVWHKGFRLSFTNIPSDFRGPAMPLLAARLRKEYANKQEDEEGKFAVDLVGRAAVSVVREPERWKDWGTSAESLQHLKQMWHVLVHCGEVMPATP